MKNVIKKIASVAMAFTLLGTGTAVTKTISPETDTTIVASAADVQLKVFSLFQNDDARCKENHSYKGSSFTAGGCGPTSLAMVYRYYRGKYLDSYKLFDKMMDTKEKTTAGTLREGITERAAEYNIGVKWSSDCGEAIAAIKNGNPVIFNLKETDGKRDFAPKNSGHYVVLSGYKGNDNNGQFFVDNPWIDRENGKKIKSGWFTKSRIEQVASKDKNKTAYGICYDINKNSAKSDILGFTISHTEKISKSGVNNFKFKKGNSRPIEGLIYCKNDYMTKAEIEIKPSKANKPSTKSSWTAIHATKCISIGEVDLNTKLKFGSLDVGSHTIYIRAYNGNKQVFSRQYSLTIY